jgi:glutamate decarboxylase
VLRACSARASDAPRPRADFRLPRVASINTSGHKYGLVPPGVGWSVWRDEAALPKELVYTVNYLGSPMSTIALNFSRPGAQVVAQYYQFLRLGREGFTAIQGHSRGVARHLADGIAALGPFVMITNGSDLPVCAARLSSRVKGYNVFDVSASMRENGWQVPAYTFPANREDLAVLRFVVRAGFTYDLADALLEDLSRVIDRLSEQKESIRDAERDSAFSHAGK